MTPSEAIIERQCRVFTEHLLGCPPSDYIVRKYAEAHRVISALSQGDRFDDLLVRFAARHRLLAKLGDSYASLFYRHSTLRKKLVLLLAILESSAPSYKLIDAPVGGSRTRLLLVLAGKGSATIVATLLGTLILFPMRLALGRPVRTKP